MPRTPATLAARLADAIDRSMSTRSARGATLEQIIAAHIRDTGEPITVPMGVILKAELAGLQVTHTLDGDGDVILDVIDGDGDAV